MLKKTQLKARGNNKLRSLFSWVLIVLLILILIASAFLITQEKNKPLSVAPTDSDPSGRDERMENSIETKLYKNELFNYSVSYTSNLIVRELGSGGGYINFVRLEEVGGSPLKGFAIGVSEQNLNTEVVRIKNAFRSENAFLAEETTIDFKDLGARQLYYKPQKIEDGEERLIVIFQKGQYTYSISTVPWQIDEVLGRFEFLN